MAEIDFENVDGVYCPFGMSAVAIPQQTLRGVQVGVAQNIPQCFKKCNFYRRSDGASPEGCWLKMAAQTIVVKS